MGKRSTASATSRAGAGDDERPLRDVRIALLCGKEAFLRQAWTDRLREAVHAEGGAIDTLRFDGASASVADVLDECRSMGLMSQHKFVIVDDADEFLRESEDEEAQEPPAPPRRGRAAKVAPRAAMTRRALLERYAQAPSPGATLILRAETWRKGNLDRFIEERGLIVDCEPLKPFEAVRQAQALAQERHKSRLEPEAARLLVDRIGPDLDRIDGELARLSLLAGPSAAIGIEIVRETVAPDREEKAWAIQEVLLNQDPVPALTKVRELIEISRLDAVPIRWVFMDMAAKVHSISRRVSQGESADSAMRSIRAWGAAAEALRSVAPRVPPGRAARLLRDSVEADWRGKTGRGDEVRALEMLAVAFADTASTLDRGRGPR